MSWFVTWYKVVFNNVFWSKLLLVRKGPHACLVRGPLVKNIWDVLPWCCNGFENDDGCDQSLNGIDYESNYLHPVFTTQECWWVWILWDATRSLWAVLHGSRPWSCSLFWWPCIVRIGCRASWSLVCYRAVKSWSFTEPTGLLVTCICPSVFRRAVSKTGAMIETVQGSTNGTSAEDVLIRQVLAAFAEYERKMIALRTKYAML